MQVLLLLKFPKVLLFHSLDYVKIDGFHGELFRPVEDKYPGKALICFSGSDGGCEMSKLLASVFQSHGLTTLAIAYVGEEGLPDKFVNVPIDTIEVASKQFLFLSQIHDILCS